MEASAGCGRICHATETTVGAVKIIAHRGASGHHPEMTRDAFETAFAQHADGIECDIQLSADGVPVCLHDPTVDRTSDGSGPVNRKNLAELRELNFGTHGRPQQILTLAELLDLLRDAGNPAGDPGYRPEIFVETKRLGTFGERRGQLENALQSALVRAGMADGDDSARVHLISFDPGSLARFRRINPDIHRIFLHRDYRGERVLHRLEDAVVSAQSPGYSVTRMRTDPQSVTGEPANTYLFTLNREDDVKWACRHGVHWIATDYPDRARDWAGGATRFSR